MQQREVAALPGAWSFGASAVTQTVSQLIQILIALATCLYCAAAAPSTGGVSRLPVEDRQDIHFERLTSGGEVLNTWVRGITQDNQGFLWFATNTGLFRYDGYVLKQYRHDPTDANTVSSDAIRTVFKDRNGMLWIGTFSSGLDRLDPAQGTFTHYRHKSGDEGSLSDDRINCVDQDKSGALWVGTARGGLNRLDPGAGTFHHYRHSLENPASLSSDIVLSVHEDRHGNFWVGTGEGLNKLDRATGRSSRFLYDPMDPQSLGENYVTGIHEDRVGTIWLTSVYANGLSALDVSTGKFTRYCHHSEEHSREEVSGITSIYEDIDGALWLGTVQDGLLKLDRERKQFLRYTKDLSNPGSLHYKGVETIFEDLEGGMWAGTKTGIARFLRRPPAFVNYRAKTGTGEGLQDNVIWSLFTDSRGFLWIGTETALHRLDRKTGRFRVYSHDPHDPSSISHNTVSAIREDGSGKLWFGTYGGGLNRYDPATERFVRYRRDPKRPGSLGSDLVFSLLVDHEGSLWVGTQSAGLNRYDPGTDLFVAYRNDPRDPRSPFPDHVTALFEDRAGQLWLGTIATGLKRFDRKSGKLTTYSFDSKTAPGRSQGAVISIREDRDGTLWVGTREGLYRVEPSSGLSTRFTMKDGLPDNSVGAIMEDRRGDLWLATAYGLSRLSPRSGRFYNYSELDGLPGNRFNLYGEGAACQTARGEMVFGSTDGFTIFDPERLSKNAYVPPVVLTDLLLFNKPVNPGKDSPLHQPIWATSSLTLNHGQSIFTLEFAALSYMAPRKNRYRYRLEGLENQWNLVDSTRRLATYTSLSAGQYVFRVQGSNNDLVWNETGVRLPITVLPPLWGTWWFSAIAMLCVVGIALSAHLFHVRNLRLAAARLELQVRERTGELRAAKESAETANQAKSTFLAHMSHELRTPLNAILGFAGILRERAASEEQRRDIDVIHRSGTHLLTLINDVLDIARIEAGRTALEIGPCDLGRMAADVVDMMSLRAAEKNLELGLAQPSVLPLGVQTDGPKLRQVLVNLVGNAIKHTERGSVTVRLEVRRAPNTDDVLVVLEVEDTGIGIAAEDQKRIFEPFVQLGNARQQTGSGLGLAISRQFVRLLGGTIQVRSALNEGSLFRVEVPAKIADQLDEEKASDKRDYVVQLEPGESPRRILVVDDEAENRRLLQRILHDAGFPVMAAVDGAQAVELFQSWHPDFIWMDMRMPVMDGAEAAQRIRALASGGPVKIAAVTASGDSSERARVMAATMDDFVVKPYRTDEIFECMARHLGVRYRPDVADQRATAPILARSEAFHALPDDLRNELRAAVFALDKNRITAVIERVSEIDSALGSALARYAERLAYTAILNAVEGARSDRPV